ncbi:MAG TPA: hypothetical protein PKW35_24985 [Nannocystaceae bacterium]|nr:hypothetical protein [Nannocystaceae bacterium]
MSLRPWMLTTSLLAGACGPGESGCPSPDELAAVEIAFIRTHEDGRRELRGASLDGSDVPLLCAGGSATRPEFVLGWSADGADLAIVESVDDESWVSVVRPGDREPARIGPGHEGRWSPVGRSLAFLAARDHEVHELRVWDGVTRLLAVGALRTISWGPDGARLLTHVERDTEGGLSAGTHRLALDGTSERLETGEYPEWSPDGRLLVYSGPADEVWILHTHDLETGEIRPIGSVGPLIPGRDPRWSFDGGLVAVGMSEFDCVHRSHGHGAGECRGAARRTGCRS